MIRFITYLASALRSLSKTLVVSMITLYRVCISPFTPASCRFYPSCSQYALDAIAIHGVYQGSLLTVKRLAKCHPFSHACGVDFVPPRTSCTTHHDSI